MTEYCTAYPRQNPLNPRKQHLIDNQREMYDYEIWKEQLQKTLPDVGLAAAVTVAAVDMLYLNTIIVLNCGMPSFAFA
ncbi:MAG: hypothetical protein LBU34_09840 [Planctomycetaceae bacterium]|nr:hypothetical protein [Planctomycetaceae bacterium]